MESKYFLIKIMCMVFCLSHIFFSNVAFCNNERTDKVVRGCKHWGFSAEFLWVLNYLDWCLKTKRTPIVYWGSTCAYYSSKGFNGSTNAWEYYFEPVSDLQYIEGDILDDRRYYDENFYTIWYYVQYIDNLKLLPKDSGLTLINLPGHDYSISSFNRQRPKNTGMPDIKLQKHLYDKEFRQMVKTKLIDNFIKLKPEIATKIETFYQAHIKGKKTIGIHLRGNFLKKEVIPVPLSIILNEAKKFEPLGYQFFVATDQQPLLDEAKNAFCDKIIYYETERYAKTTSPLKPQQLSPKNGEDLLIEVFLLSKCDHLIHTLSQVSTMVLYFNPEMDHTLIY